MSPSAIIGALEGLSAGGELSFSLSDIPFDELLLRLHMARFTGVVALGEPSDRDRIFLREGAVVGVRPRPSLDRASLSEAVVTLKLTSREAVAAAGEVSANALELGEQLVSSGILTGEELDRAVEEQARRRIFAIYELDAAPTRVCQGIERLAHFHAVYVDIRPAIAFGTVVRAAPSRKQAMLQKVRGKRVRLVAPYDEQRNGYGFPPPVLLALQDLALGVSLDGDIALPGLSTSETAGVLLLFDRMSLLRIE